VFGVSCVWVGVFRCMYVWLSFCTMCICVWVCDLVCVCGACVLCSCV